MIARPRPQRPVARIRGILQLEVYCCGDPDDHAGEGGEEDSPRV